MELEVLKTESTMKANNKEKDFDAVKMMRDIRKEIHVETENMSYEELRAYIDAQLAQKSRLIGQQ
ncbi:MAG: hypothetical protein ABR572_10835 [Cryomorphaceae bacterium]|nr:hypothetical protein [Flavobacteriales bacterium]